MKILSKIVGWMFWIVGIILTGYLLILILNPFGFAFQTGFKIKNESGRTVYVTPIGVLGTKRRVLPQTLILFPLIPIINRENIRIPAGRLTTINYNWDDITFTEIAVKDEYDTWKQVSVLSEEDKVCCSLNKQKVYVIPRFDDLEPISPAVKNAVTTEKSTSMLMVLLSACLNFIGPIFIFLGKRLRTMLE